MNWAIVRWKKLGRMAKALLMAGVAAASLLLCFYVFGAKAAKGPLVTDVVS